MPTVYALTPKMQVFGADGYFGVGYKLYTYDAGTSTPASTYTSSTGSSANTNPVIADSRGEFDLWLDASKLYKFILKTDADVTVWTVDNFGILNNIADGSVTEAKLEEALQEAIDQWLCFAVSDETTAITSGTAKLTFRLPACTILEIPRASLNTASTSGAVTVDINDDGSTILSTKLTLDQDEKTSTTAATAAVLSATTVADDSEMTIDIDGAGTGAKGLKIYIHVRWT